MELSRRRTLHLAGASLSSVVVAGCLSAAGPGSGTDGSDPAEGGDTDGSDPSGTPVDRSPRVADPPHEITEPECGDDDSRDPLWLCANMPAEPSVEFEQVETSSRVLADEGLRLTDAAPETGRGNR